jgi:hypothetical protein
MASSLLTRVPAANAPSPIPELMNDRRSMMVPPVFPRLMDSKRDAPSPNVPEFTFFAEVL